MKIKNVNTKISARVLAILLATGIATSEFVLTKQNPNIKVPLKQVVEDFQDDTLLDEAEEESIAMYQDMKITEAADKVLTLIDSHDSLNNEEQQWLKENAKEITEETLLWSIKSTIANEIGVPTNEIQNIELPYLNEYKDLVFCMTYDDKEYEISKKEAYMLNALALYYQVKASDLNYLNCKIAINSAKILIMTSVDENNYVLDSKRSLKEAKKLLKNS